MAVDNIVTDPALTRLLNTSQETLKSALALIDLTSQSTAAKEDTTGTDHGSETQKLLQAQKQLHAYLSILRGQNRKAILDVRNTKGDTAEARQEVDRLHLQLQNLYYEQRHLEGEISACEDYDHEYTHLPLLSLPEYLTHFPDQSTLPEEDLMPMRIEHEKVEREKLEAQRQELLKKKAELVAENGRRKDDLKKLDERMEKFLEGAKGIMEVLEKEYE